VVVEDEDDLRQPIRRSLAAAGYTVLEASSAEEAVELARDHDGQIDLVLTDVVLPGLSGKQLVEELRQLYPQLASILVSGYGGQVLSRRGVKPNQVRLSKPVDLDELKAAIDEILG